MTLGTTPEWSDSLVERLDIDLDVLDHALMDLVTSDWQTLDDGHPQDTPVVSLRPAKAD